MRACKGIAGLILAVIVSMVGSVGVASAEPTFQQIFDNHNAVMLLIDPTTGEIRDANPAASAFYGFSRTRMRDMSIQDINQLTPEQVAAERRRAQAEDRNHFIFRHELANGEVKTVEVYSQPFEFDGETLLLSVINDLTDQRAMEADLWHYQTQLETMVDEQTGKLNETTRKTILGLAVGAAVLFLLVVLLVAALKRQRAAEREVRENREHYRRLVNGLKEHFVYSHDPNGTFTYVSPSVLTILGYTPEEFQTDVFEFYTDNPINERAQEHTQGSCDGVQQPPYQIEVRKKDGGKALMEVVESPVFNAFGDVVAVEGIAQDVTDRVRLEEDLRQALVNAEQANHAKSEFLATMSHELRTPLNSIIGFAEMMSYEIKGALPEDYREYTGLITNSGRFLLETVNSILDLAKIEAGRFELNPEPTDVDAVIDEVLSLLRVQAGSRDLELIDATGEDLPELTLDRMRLRQVLMNVIGNAIKFTETGTVTIKSALDDGWLAIDISDTGIGMTEEEIAIALEPFRQVHGTAHARRYQGTGLGLSLSRQIMYQHGGTLSVDSEKGKGTIVHLRFPLDPPYATNAEAGAPADAHGDAHADAGEEGAKTGKGP